MWISGEEIKDDAVLPVKISENLREGMFDQACLGQYGQFQVKIGILLGRMGCFVSRKWDCGKSIVLLLSREASLVNFIRLLS